MDPTDKQALADAVNELIESADAKRMFTQLMGVSARRYLPSCGTTWTLS